MGPPAAGKGTQAEMIQKRYNIPVASPGAILQEQWAAGTDLGLEAEAITRKGQLSPDPIIVGLVEKWLEKRFVKFLLDGFPRSEGQAEALGVMLVRRGTPLDVVIALQADRAVLEQRVASRLICTRCRQIVSVGLQIQNAAEPCPKCGGSLGRRSDETPEILAERMRQYSEKSAPLLTYYESRHLLRRIDRSQCPRTVFAAVTSVLEEV